MTGSPLGTEWCKRFGLALAPLFEQGELEGTHEVLLDGGFGTFALSTSGDMFDPVASSGWIWSSDVPHHVAVDDHKVQVTRWDRPRDAQSYSRQSVDSDLDGFYRYLTEDRVKSNRTVVEHLLGLFRRLRSLVHDAGLPDEDTTDVFTATLARLAFDCGLDGSTFDHADKLEALNKGAYETAVQDIQLAHSTYDALRFQPALAVRHASGQVFQEAHFELMRVGAQDLFGLVGMAEAAPVNRGGAHFTPPALARIIVEQAIKQLGDLDQRPKLAISDPACGSGAFLYEAIRVLRRMNFQGDVRIIGRDISRAATSMARFVLDAAVRDWKPNATITIDIEVGDSLVDGAMSPADLIIMNPPFVSAIAQTKEQRARLEEVVGSAAGRGDLSMAFISLALKALNAGGALGALFPASLLSLGAAKSWRAWLAENSDIRLLGSIGDFGVFSQALVQVACGVMVKESSGHVEKAIGLLTGNDPNATGAALRRLRAQGGDPLISPIEAENWSIFPVAKRSLKDRDTWKLLSPGDERLLRRAEDANLATIEELFDVRQGVQTGLLKAFLLDEAAFQRLPSGEKAYFRDATMTDSIKDGQVVKLYHLFFPYAADGSRLFETEADMRKAVQRFSNEYLKPNELELKRRAAIRQANRSDWWGLMRPRQFASSVQPKLVTKFFAAEGGFVCDFEGLLVPVTGHAWMPRPALQIEAHSEITAQQLIAAYGALFNTTAFMKLVSCFAPSVSGGQFDLSARHVARVPAPNLLALYGDDSWKPLVSELIDLGLEMQFASPLWRRRAEAVADRFYGGGHD